MLSRYIAKPSHLRLLALITSQSHVSNHKNPLPLSLRPPLPVPNYFTSFPTIPRYFSSNRDNNNNNNNNQPDLWNFSSENDQDDDSAFGEDAGSLQGMVADASAEPKEDPWVIDLEGNGSGERHATSVSDDGDDIQVSKEIGTSGRGRRINEWETGEGYTDWSTAFEEGREEEVFDIGDVDQQDAMMGFEDAETSQSLKSEEQKKLELEEQELSAVLKGPDRAFGDLIAASGITDAMLDSLIALKDLDGIQGLPPLCEIEDMRYEKSLKKSSRAEMERLKQEEVAKARVRQVDSKGRAYGTGKRKCSIARVWIQPGEGKFKINDKQFDVYFPMLDHRAALLRPFTETKTLGLMDVNCTVKGGGVSGQVGAIRLGISRALQNWAPDQLRPPLKAAGFLTRDSRIVERKKPGRAKARRSFQWVKR